jgi:hypothetical protein
VGRRIVLLNNFVNREYAVGSVVIQNQKGDIRNTVLLAPVIAQPGTTNRTICSLGGISGNALQPLDIPRIASFAAGEYLTPGYNT